MGLFDSLRAPSRGFDSGVHADTTTHRYLPPTGSEGVADAIPHQVDRLDHAASIDPADLDPEEFEALLTSRLVSTATLAPYGPVYRYLAPYTDEISEVLTLDLPTAVVMLPDTEVHGHGHQLSWLADRARANLTTVMDRAEVDITPLTRGSGAGVAIVGSSPYTGSFARFLTKALARWAPAADASNGVVFAVPDRHSLVVQPCSTKAEARTALEVVPEFARELYASASGPISPHVYHWYFREVTRLTEQADDGSMTLTPTAPMAALWGEHGRTAG